MSQYPGDDDSGSYEINFPYNGGGIPEQWLVWREKLLKFLVGQGLSTGPQRYIFTYYQAALDIGIYTVENINKLLAKKTKYTLPAHTFCKQSRYL